MAFLYNNVEQRPEWLNTAKHGIAFLEKHCFDTDGRMFFEVTRNRNGMVHYGRISAWK
jgi:N-acylglucosamine 2-epimerase